MRGPPPAPGCSVLLEQPADQIAMATIIHSPVSFFLIVMMLSVSQAAFDPDVSTAARDRSFKSSLRHRRINSLHAT